MSPSIGEKYFTEDIFHLSIPVVAIDIVIFTIFQGKLRLMLAKRDITSLESKFMLPGGIVRAGISLEDNFDDILLRKTGISGVYKEQLYTFGSPYRDARGHVISIAYYAFVGPDILLKSVDFTKVELIEYNQFTIDKMAFDHGDILQYAYKRLVWKLEYTNIVSNIIGPYFTLSLLQQMYEIILVKNLDKRNFRKKILSLDILRETGKFDRSSSHRPAKLYEFYEKDLKIIELI